jgi:hypothetical protein
VLLYVCYATITISVTLYATLQAQSVLLYVCYATITISVTVYVTLQPQSVLLYIMLRYKHNQCYCICYVTSAISVDCASNVTYTVTLIVLVA